MRQDLQRAARSDFGVKPESLLYVRLQTMVQTRTFPGGKVRVWTILDLMRLLVAARLSRSRAGQTGIETQDREVMRWAEQNGHTIVYVAADTKSGTVQPWNRPNLKPWVTEPAKMALYDGIVAYRFDRLSRGDDASTSEIEAWARNHGKVLMTEDGLQYPCEGVEGIRWDVTKRIAREEWLKTSERYTRMQAHLIASEHLVGTIPFGFRAIPKGDHKTLEPVPELAPVLQGMVSRAIEGQSLVKICEWLDTVTRSKGGEIWHPKTVRHILRNEALIGRRHQAVKDKTNGKTVKGVLKFEGVIDVATFKILQAALDANSFKLGKVAEGPSMLTGVIFCAKCGRVMHRKLRTETRKRDNSSYVIATYRCSGTAREPSTCRNMVSMPALHGFVDDWFTNRPLADAPVVETVLKPGNGYADELEQNARDVAELDIDDPDYMEKLMVLREERKRLQALPAEPDRVEHRPIGVVRDRWLTLDEAEKRKLLMDSGVRIEVVKATADRFPHQANTSRLDGDTYAAAFTDVQDGIMVDVYFPKDLSAKVTGSIVMTRPTVTV